MPRLLLLFTFCIHLHFTASAQDTDYAGTIQSHREKYVMNHGAVKGGDKKYFHFFPASETYRVSATFERIYEAPWFKMPTSGNSHQVYRVYGILRFSLHDTLLRLHIYESQELMKTREYADHLFIPFTDKTCGDESYDNGRYIDLTTKDLETGSYTIDFNKAYNPYCAYISNRYNCPIPPRENDLPVSVRSGEMKFGKDH